MKEAIERNWEAEQVMRSPWEREEPVCGTPDDTLYCIALYDAGEQLHYTELWDADGVEPSVLAAGAVKAYASRLPEGIPGIKWARVVVQWGDTDRAVYDIGYREVIELELGQVT